MSLNTFWLQRAINALETRSHIALVLNNFVHWRITMWTFHMRNGDASRGGNIFGAPACALVDAAITLPDIASIDFNAWSTVAPEETTEFLHCAISVCGECAFRYHEHRNKLGIADFSRGTDR